MPSPPPDHDIAHGNFSMIGLELKLHTLYVKYRLLCICPSLRVTVSNMIPDLSDTWRDVC